MSEDFDGLVTKYGGPAKIPHEVLYEYLVRPDVLQSLTNLATVGLEKAPLSVEVRRRSRSDLFWLVKFFTWGTNPAGVDKPISENKITYEEYKIVCDFFVQKDSSRTVANQDLCKNRLLLWPRGGFKALALETKIPTPDGFKFIKDVGIGDVVFDDSGAQCSVVGVSPVFYGRKCYEVVFSSGESIVADADHLWVTDARNDRDKTRLPNSREKVKKAPSIKTTEEIARTLKCRKENNHRVEVADYVRCEGRKYSIAPYVLGCWLGDGTSSTGQLTSADEEVIQEIRNEGEAITKSDCSQYRWVFNGGPSHKDFKKKGSSFSGRLRRLGLLNNKHIPTEYLFGSFEDRFSLLQGLMDTDGTVSSGRPNRCSFTNKNLRLVEQVRVLAASLGFKPNGIINFVGTIDGEKKGIYHRIDITTYSDAPIFRLSRKRKNLTERRKVSLQNYRTITDVREVETRPTKCLMVDSPTHMFLVGEGFIPTHNSTIDVCDAVQWILNFPDIRILFLTGVDDLAIGFVSELKGHFVRKEEEHTLMSLFFPEFCMSERELSKGNQFEFNCPVWSAKNVHRKEPTVLASSIGSTKSGLHFEIIKADDAVCDKNTESAEQCQTISKKLFLAKKLLRPGDYYFDYIGTRYADEDHYGVLLEKNVGDVRTVTKACWEYTENLSTSSRILIGRAIVIKPEVIQKLKNEGKPASYKEAGETGCDLLLPNLMPYSWLLREYGENEETFEGQLNQNPRAASFSVFEKVLLVQNTVQFTELPSRGPVSQTWDFAFSKKKGRDYCTASSAIWNDRGQFFVHDLIRRRFTPSDLAKAVVNFAIKYRPFIIGIENASGSRLLEPAILSEARKTNDPYIIALCGRIDWVTAETQKDAKKIRMAALQPWLTDGKMKFAAHLPYLGILYDEFEKCMGAGHHDDIPDVLSRQLKYAPQMAQAIVKNDLQTWSKVEAGWKLLFEEGFQSPFGGFLLTHNPETGALQWITEAIQSPVVEAPGISGMREPALPGGLDRILGSGILG